MPAVLTLRQAKAAHKARGGPAVTERELRQLQREIQLDHRAWAIKERDKTRSVVAQKRAEEQQRAKAEEEAVRLGTQRRCDRFGHKSSQYHLGAFFTRASKLGQPLRDYQPAGMLEQPSLATYTFDEDEDELDDETLLSALHEVDVHVKPQLNSIKDDACLTKSATSAELTPRLSGDMIWYEFLESATQIQRELASESSEVSVSNDSHERVSLDSSCSLGLTSQDIEMLDPSCTTTFENPHYTTSNVKEDRGLRPVILTQMCTGTQRSEGKSELSRGHTSVEFSLTQLEHFVDDDMTLSQI